MVSGRNFEREITLKKSLLVIALFVLAFSCVHAQNLTAAGATFPYPIYSKWFSEYERRASRRRNQLSIDRLGRRHQAGLFRNCGLRRLRHAHDRRSAQNVRRQADSHSHGARRRRSHLQRSGRQRPSLQPRNSGRTSTWPRSPTGTIPPSPRIIPACIFPTRRSSWSIAPMAAARRSSSPTT